ncbi:hypothetical protein AYI68_g6536 [Smittium mucronatum]|uniref:Uncharacterized protein n=1 Tax=Smittium mucronatum TaxID=133383 RepID=A0A1R0GR91_9FUNG|nr:hypothetical protein AYI68_g6536 [Smittium mucronatum]
MDLEHFERGIQDPIQDSIPHEAEIGGETSSNITLLNFFNDNEISKKIGPHGPNFLGWPSADITPTEEQEEVKQGSEHHPNEGSVSAFGKARNRGIIATYSWPLQSSSHDSKKARGLRPLLDLRKQNSHVEEQNFKMETLK